MLHFNLQLRWGQAPSKLLSRYSPDASRPQKIVNSLYRVTAFYGYSVWRPICCLLIFFACFSMALVYIDVFHYRVASVSVSTLLLDHLQELVRPEPNSAYFSAEFRLRGLLVTIEKVLLIPPLAAACIIAIKKLLKRS